MLIVIRPDGRVPPSELQNFFDYQQEKNNLLVLTGQDSHLTDAVEDRLRELYAIEQISKRLKPGRYALRRGERSFRRRDGSLSQGALRWLQPSLLPRAGGD